MSAIADVFARRMAAGQLTFIPFLTAGDPDLAFTQRLICEVDAAGADLIEIGFPYSDPIADGPVIQASYTRALARKLRVAEIFQAVGQLRGKVQAPIVGMVSYAIIFRVGTESFLQQAQSAGFAGLIVPDLPGDESAAFSILAQQFQLDLIQLVAPTTPPERAGRILQNGSGFVYCIAVAGTTGARESLAVDLNKMLAGLKEQTSLPLAVGFGLSRAEQIRALQGKAQGAIVGSAIVRLLEGLDGTSAAADKVAGQVATTVRELAEAAHAPH